MRFLYLSFFIVLFSCSTDSDLANHPESASQLQPQDALTRKLEPHPAQNPSNPYDYSGQLFDSLFSAYHNADELPVTTATIVARVNKVAEENAQFASLKNAYYTPVSAIDITALLSNPLNCVSDFTNASGLSATGKTRLAAFINGVVPLCNTATDYQIVHDYISTFETITLQATGLSAYDKEIMLITSSIARYSAYRKPKKPKKKEDPEWDLLITHVTAGAEGAELGVCEATSRALATGIAGQP